VDYRGDKGCFCVCRGPAAAAGGDDDLESAGGGEVAMLGMTQWTCGYDVVVVVGLAVGHENLPG